MEQTKVAAETATQQELVLEHIDFAKCIAHSMHRAHGTMVDNMIRYEDFVGAALIGLCQAAKRYKTKSPATFKSFAYLRVRGAIFDLLRLQRHGYERVNEKHLLSRTEENLEEDNTEFKMWPPLQEESGISVHRHVHKDAPDVSWSMLDSTSTPEDLVSERTTSRLLQRLIERLPSKERRLIELRYVADLPFSEIGKALEISSKTRVSSVHMKAIERLRQMITSECGIRNAGEDFRAVI